MKYTFDHTSTNRKYAQTIALCVVFFVLILSISLTLAYFSSKDDGGGSKNFSTLDLTVTATYPTDEPLIPNMIYDGYDATITTSNTSEDAYVRVKMYCEIDGVIDTTLVTPIVPYMEVVGSETVVRWIYNSVDGYWYYVGYVNSTQSAKFLTGYNVGEVGGLKDIHIVIKAEGIQRKYLAYEDLWETASDMWKSEIAKYDVETGADWT